MFSFLDRDKGRQKKAREKHGRDESAVASGTEITYKKSLISKYHEEHENLLLLFGQALSAYQQARDGEFLAHLRDLHIALRKHLLDEELNLYIYLRHCYRNDKNKQELITRFKKSSKKTSVATFTYIKQLTEEAEMISRDEAFISQLLQIGNMLETLLAAEEQHLYPIYKKPVGTAELSF